MPKDFSQNSTTGGVSSKTIPTVILSDSFLKSHPQYNFVKSEFTRKFATYNGYGFYCSPGILKSNEQFGQIIYIRKEEDANANPFLIDLNSKVVADSLVIRAFARFKSSLGVDTIFNDRTPKYLAIKNEKGEPLGSYGSPSNTHLFIRPSVLLPFYSIEVGVSR